MNRKHTILWRMVVLGLFASMVPLGLMALDRHGTVVGGMKNPGKYVVYVAQQLEVRESPTHLRDLLQVPPRDAAFAARCELLR